MAGLPTYDRRTILENTGVVRMPGGEGLFDIATVAARGAREAGAAAEQQQIADQAAAGARNALVRDAEGKSTFQPLDNSTAANRAYNRAASAAYQAQFETDQRRTAIELTALHGDDPAAFEAAWAGNTQGALQQVPEAFRPDAQITLSQLGTQTYGGILLRKQATDRALNAGAVKAQIGQVVSDIVSLADTGGGGSDASKGYMVKLDGLLKEAVANRTMSQAEADISRDSAMNTARAYAVANSAVGVFTKSGPLAANKFLTDALSDPNLKISATQRAQIINHAQAKMSDLTAGRGVALAEVRDQAKGLETRSNAGNKVPAGAYDSLALRAEAFGDTVGAGNLRQAEIVTQFVQSYMDKPLAEIDAAATAAAREAKAETSDETATLKADGLARLWGTKARAMQDDALTYGANVHEALVGKLGAINFLDPNTAVAGIRQRVRQAALISEREGVPVLPLKKDEIGKLAALIPTLTIDHKQALMLTLGEGLRDKVGPIMQEIAKGPGTGSFIAAAGLASEDPAVSRRILQGVEVMANTKDALPEANDARRKAINDQLGNAFLADNMLARRIVVEGALALYAAGSAAEGDLSKDLNTTRMTQAVTDASGGILKRNGANVIAPERGMTQDTFDRMMSGLQESDLGPTGGVKSDGTPAKLADIRDHGVLRSVGDGRYIVTLNGLALQMPAGALSEFGRSEWILDLRQTPIRGPVFRPMGLY